MRKCVICKARYIKGSKTSFHKFPSELTLRNAWLENMNAVNWTPKEKDSLCSKHFDTKCFVTHNTRTALKSGSIPTLFEGLFENQNVSEELQKATNDKTYSEEKMKEESQPADFTYPYNYATSSTSQGMGTSPCSSKRQSSNRCEVKRMLSESMDSSAPDNLKSDLRESMSSDHDYESSPKSKKTRIQYSVAHDHRYESTPTSSKESLQHTKRLLKLSNARVKALTQRVKRLKIKVTGLKTVINDLSKRNKASEECILHLKQYDEFQMELFNRMVKNKGTKNIKHDKYPPALCAFAITLYFYSPKAYTYVRNKFNLALPHPRVIRSW